MSDSSKKKLPVIDDAAKLREFEIHDAALRRSGLAFRAELRMQARWLMISDEFTEQDLLRMLRALVFSGEDNFACLEGPEEGLAKRAVLQDLLPAAPAPVPFSRSALLCPLHERSLRGDRDVPCCVMRGDDERRAKGEPPVGRRVARESVRPCRTLSAIIWHELPRILKLPLGDEQPAERPGEAEVRRQRDAVLRAGPAEEDPEKLRAQLRFLMDSGRLPEWSLLELVDAGLLLTDTVWLPCRNDPHRHVYKDDPEDLSADPPHPMRTRCDLQVRALLGDRTVPCTQALAAAVRIESVEKVRERYDVLSIEELPVTSWDGEEDQPGGPRDPVHLLGIRPCYVVGRLVAHGLYPYLEALTRDMELLDADSELLLAREREILADDPLTAVGAEPP